MKPAVTAAAATMATKAPPAAAMMTETVTLATGPGVPSSSFTPAVGPAEQKTGVRCHQVSMTQIHLNLDSTNSPNS